MNSERERLGKIVRQAWVRFAEERPSPKPSHLIGWDDLDEENKEVDRQIGEAVALAVTPRDHAEFVENVREQTDALYWCVLDCDAFVSYEACERVRAIQAALEKLIGGEPWGLFGEICKSLDAAEQRAERLTAALEPFARYARILDEDTPFKHEDSDHMLTINPHYPQATITMAHLRAARTTLDDAHDTALRD